MKNRSSFPGRAMLLGLVSLFLLVPAAYAAPSVVAQQLVSSQRVDRTNWDYTYTITVRNDGPALTGAIATVTSSAATVTKVMKGTVTLGSVAAGATVTSTDTFIIRQDRSVPLNPSALTWAFSSQGLAPILSALESGGQLPRLDRSSSIAGPDVNGNGIRDDIEAYVATLTDTGPQRAALLQTSKALGNAMLAGAAATDETTLKSVSVSISRAVHCVWTQYDPSVAGNKVALARKLTVNTRARLVAYDQYNAKRNGTSTRAPIGDTCEP